MPTISIEPELEFIGALEAAHKSQYGGAHFFSVASANGELWREQLGAWAILNISGGLVLA